jgi:hypothetical protein
MGNIRSFLPPRCRVWKRVLWSPIAWITAILWALINAGSILKGEILPVEWQGKLPRVLDIASAIPWWGWAIGWMGLLLVFTLEGAYRVISRLEAEVSPEDQESRQWPRVAESISRYLTELRLGQQAPPNPMGQFTLAQANAEQAFAAFKAKRTPEGALAVQRAESDLLAAAPFIYTRPSPEYRALFDDSVARLEQVKVIGASEEERGRAGGSCKV